MVPESVRAGRKSEQFDWVGSLWEVRDRESEKNRLELHCGALSAGLGGAELEDRQFTGGF